jgi:hypothetical protein
MSLSAASASEAGPDRGSLSGGGAEFMQTLVDQETEQIDRVERPRSTLAFSALLEALVRLKQSISQFLGLSCSGVCSHPRRRTLVLTCLLVFFIAVGVRLLYLQDNYAQLMKNDPWMPNIARHYENEARRYQEEGRILYPRDPVDPGDARLILHPPGYSAMIAAIFGLWGDSESRIRLVQIVADALSAVLVLLIATQLLPFTVSLVSAILVALSPHLAFYSLWISPDSTCVLPILAAVYLIIKASRRPRFALMIAAGAMIGISCWLRANAMMLAPFLAVSVMLTFEKGRRLRYAAALVIAAVVAISPITIRNWILFHHFVPISIAGGENLVVGIADFDKEGRFGMPASDGDVGIKDAEWFGRPEYRESAWFPDGVERDQARFSKGFEVIRSNPAWFLGVAIRRAFFMLRYNGSAPADWPFNTSTVPIVSAEPPVMHTPSSARDRAPVWSGSAASWLGEGSFLSNQAETSLEPRDQTLRLRSDGSEFGDQIASAPIALRPERDYLLNAAISTEPGPVVVKITTTDRSIALALEVVDAGSLCRESKKEKKRNGLLVGSVSEDSDDATSLSFSSGHRTEVCLTIANDGQASPGGVTRIGELRLFDLGPTPYLWTRYPRMVLRGVQRNLFKTTAMLPLVVAGVLLLALSGRGSALAALLVVPAYYICTQSVLSTEYRYILAIHYFLFVMAGVTFYCLAVSIRRLLGKPLGMLPLGVRTSAANRALTEGVRQ